MIQRGTVSPSSLTIDITSTGVTIEYLDGHRVHYQGTPQETDGVVRCQPGKEVHVLITGESETAGIMIYLNDRKTSDEILEATGVGRIFLDSGEELELSPGVWARGDGHAIEITAKPEVAGGRVFVFEEDELGERSYEIVE